MPDDRKPVPKHADEERQQALKRNGRDHVVHQVGVDREAHKGDRADPTLVEANAEPTANEGRQPANAEETQCHRGIHGREMQNLDGKTSCTG